MALLRYFPKKSKDSNNQSSPSLIEPTGAEIEILIDESVERELAKKPLVQRRARYNHYSEQERMEIGKYAQANSTAAALRKFGPKYTNLKESTVRTFKDRYRESLIHGPQKRPVKHGRPLMLGEEFDNRVKARINVVRESAGVVNRHIVQCIATGILKALNPMVLKMNGGHIDITDSWAKSLLNRMGYTKRAATTGKLQLPAEYVHEKSFSFLNEIARHVIEYKIPSSMILNWDQTPLHYIPSSKWTMDKEGASKVAIHGGADKRSLTAVLTVSLAGNFLPMQLIYPGKTNKSLPVYAFPDGFSLTQNPSHWSNEETMELYVEEVLRPYLEKQRADIENPDQPALLIYDAFKAHTTSSIQSKLAALNAKLVMVPKNMTDHLQPLDISVNKPAKNYLQRRFNEWYTEQVQQLEETGDGPMYDKLSGLLKSSVTLRELGARWISGLYHHFQDPVQTEIIRNGFEHCGIKRICDSGPVCDDPFSE